MIQRLAKKFFCVRLGIDRETGLPSRTLYVAPTGIVYTRKNWRNGGRTMVDETRVIRWRKP